MMYLDHESANIEQYINDMVRLVRTKGDRKSIAALVFTIMRIQIRPMLRRGEQLISLLQ